MVKSHGFRSNFELQIAGVLVKHEVKYTYEDHTFKYVVKPRRYTPDFYLEEFDIHLEVKGLFTSQDRQKMLYFKKQHPDIDIRFVFMNAKNKLYKGSKTTYGEWATKHGFQWHEGTVPPEWYGEGEDNG